MAGIRIKSLQALDEQFDNMLFVVDLENPNTTLCLSGRELKAAVGLKQHTHPFEDIDGLVGELEENLNKAGECPIKMSVIIFKKRFFPTIGHSVLPEVWNGSRVTRSKYVNSKGETASEINPMSLDVKDYEEKILKHIKDAMLTLGRKIAIIDMQQQ